MSLVRTVLSLGVLGAAAASVLGLSVAIAVGDRYSRDLPDHMPLATYVPRSGSRVEAADGTTMSRRAEQRRTFVQLAAIPPLVQSAFTSAEDRNYRSHGGVDPVAVLRAALGNLGGGQVSGASTITQQVAKNLLVGSERSLDRKVREALLATRMDRDLGKDRVIEIYLNEIYLGSGAYGVAEAARTYFGKSLKDLTPAQAALLAGMPKAPTSFNPFRNPSRATDRRNYVLRRMAEDGVITVPVAQAAQAEPLGVVPGRGRDDGETGQEGWFEDLAWKAAGIMLGAERLSSQDVVVRTTLRPAFQAAAEEALREGVVRADRALGWRGPPAHVRFPVDWAAPALEPPAGGGDWTVGVVETVGRDASVALSGTRRVRLGPEGTRWTGRSPASLLTPGDVVLLDLSGTSPELAQMPETEGALVALDPRNGDVLALVGGFSRERSVFDRATMSRRQAGSSFKPVLYGTALAMGYDPTSPLLDAVIALEQGRGQEDWRPSDAKTAGHGGLITLRRALELSRNLASVRLLWDIGLEDVQSMSRKLGLAVDRPLTYVAALGAVEVSPLQMAAAYATFASGGEKVVPRFVTEVDDRDRRVLVKADVPFRERVMDPVAAAQMSSVLRGVVERGTARRAFEGFAAPLSGKTGTTNSARDAWFVGFSPEIVVAVWIGRDDNKALADDAGGGKVAAPVVRDFLDRLGTRMTVGPVPVPDGARTITVDPVTGLPARKGVTEIVRADDPRSEKEAAPVRDPARDARTGGRGTRRAEPPRAGPGARTEETR